MAAFLVIFLCFLCSMTAEAVMKEAPSFIYTEAIAKDGELDMVLHPIEPMNPHGIRNFLNKTAIMDALENVNGLEPAGRYEHWADFFEKDISKTNLEKDKLVLGPNDVTARFLLIDPSIEQRLDIARGEIEEISKNGIVVTEKF